LYGQILFHKYNMSKGIISKDEDYSQWFNELVIKADMAEYSPVRGCMIIKPYGYSIWEKMQAVLDKMFKDTGHENAYFPLLIPKSFFSKEASHVEGFAKECAVVTHYRLKNDENGQIVVDEDAKLEEELIIRPTSETIIWNTYRGWIQIVPRPAYFGEPVGKRNALGNAHTYVFAYQRIFMAGGAHRPRHMPKKL
jgi:prolyl-tRNA synthetase